MSWNSTKMIYSEAALPLTFVQNAFSLDASGGLLVMDIGMPDRNRSVK